MAQHLHTALLARATADISLAKQAWGRGDESPNNLGYQVRQKEGYFPTPPMDTMQNIRSEMVAPVVRKDDLIGWVSVHNVRGPHQWTTSEIAAIEAACAKVRRELESVEKA